MQMPSRLLQGERKEEKEKREKEREQVLPLFLPFPSFLLSPFLVPLFLFSLFFLPSLKERREEKRKKKKKESTPAPPRKISLTSRPPVGGLSDIKLIRTDTTLDLSQKAEKVCWRKGKKKKIKTNEKQEGLPSYRGTLLFPGYGILEKARFFKK